MRTIGYFQELQPEGYIKQSIMRLMSFMSLCIGSLIAILSLLFVDIQTIHVVLVFIFLLGAFAPKALQKFAESKFIK